MTNKEYNKMKKMMQSILSITDNENYERTHYILKKALEQFYDDREYERTHYILTKAFEPFYEETEYMKKLQMYGYNNFTEFIDELLTRCQNSQGGQEK